MREYGKILAVTCAFSLVSLAGPASVSAEESLRNKCRRITGASYIFQAYLDGKGRLICVHPDIETGAIENKMNGATGYPSRFSREPEETKGPIATKDQ